MSQTLSSAQQQVFNSLLSVFMLGAGAIIGLIGGGSRVSRRTDREGLREQHDEAAEHLDG